jgi:hypothetical protein
MDSARDYRAITTCALVGHGINPHQLLTTLERDAPTFRALSHLASIGISVGTMADADLKLGASALDEAIKRDVQGVIGCLITDCASFRKWKTSIVLFSSPALMEPVLLTTVVPAALIGLDQDSIDDEDDEYDSEEAMSYRANQAAADVKLALTKYGMNINDITNIHLSCGMRSAVTACGPSL